MEYLLAQHTHQLNQQPTKNQTFFLEDGVLYDVDSTRFWIFKDQLKDSIPASG